MKRFIFGLALVSIACAQYSEYSPPLESISEDLSPSTEYLPPAQQEETVLADDGYRYKTVRRLRHRNRRDVSELSSAEYLPPHQELSSEAPVEHAELSSIYLAPVEQQQTVLADDGYRYKTVRRLRHRNRRDVNELASAEYLPPHQELSSEQSEPTTSYLAPHQETSVEHAEPSSSYLAPAEQEQTVVADDGYRYKTVRRLRHRSRRDVSELTNAEYLPPHQEASSEASVEYVEPSTSYLAPVEQEQTVVADDGYRYKTVRRLRHRSRRDVSELSSAEYLPPHQELSSEASAEYAEPSTSYLAPVEQEQTDLANDGYRYKTVRRLRHRNRRDVSELSSAEYLPPHQELSSEATVEYAEPSTSYLAPVEQEQTVVSDDGYRYKTVRRLRHRNRRDVSELPSAEYLPPHQEFSTEQSAPSSSYLAPQQEVSAEYTEVAPVQQEETVLADDGYRYKTVLRFRNRKRRDVSELTSAEYLPPHQEFSSEYTQPSTSYLAPVEQEETVLADDGYRYKTVRKFKVHRH